MFSRGSSPLNSTRSGTMPHRSRKAISMHVKIERPHIIEIWTPIIEIRRKFKERIDIMDRAGIECTLSHNHSRSTRANGH